MNEQYLDKLFRHLKNKGIILEEGLTDVEITQIEEAYRIHFPLDLKQVLSFKLPISDDFPNWRDDSSNKIEKMLNRPLQGICFDIEHNDFWMKSWGEKPTSLNECFEIARHEVSKAPQLIPVYAHRYIASEPLDAGNPVFSVWQTDIIYYGDDLMNYFDHEFFSIPYNYNEKHTYRSIRFWEEIIEMN